MPELPEIEVTKRSLYKTINKAKIISVKVNNKNLRYQIPNAFSKNLTNENILKISRRSKYLIFYFKTKLLLVHFGMTGKLLIMKRKTNKSFKTSFYYDSDTLKKHNHIYFYLNNGLILIYNDVRRFGFFKIYDTTKINEISFLKKLGPEPLGKKFNSTYFFKFIKNKKKNIKNILMDQTFVSGLGNIYVNESLFLSKIKPTRIGSSISKNEIKILIISIIKVLKFSILKGGSSIRDFKNISGKTGSFQQFFYVYGKNNKKCSRISCNGKIKKIVISNRSSYFCNKCQN